MSLKRKLMMCWEAFTRDWRLAAGAIASGMLGLGLLITTEPRHWFYHASYDWLQGAETLLLPTPRINDFLIVSCDEETSRVLGEDPVAAKNRRLHAELANQLFARHARAVAFDIVFDESGQGDSKLAEAIANRPVALAKSFQTSGVQGGPKLATESLPVEPILTAAAGHVGEVEFESDIDGAIRRHPHGTNALSWIVAQICGQIPVDTLGQRWIHYYGRPGVIPRKSFYQLLDTNFPAGLVENRVILVGRGGARLTPNGSSSDRCLTPYGVVADGVEIHAMVTRNLLQRDWVTEFPPLLEAFLVFCWGVGLPFLLNGARLKGGQSRSIGFGLRRCLARTVVSIVGMAILACGLFWWGRLWLPWTVTAAQTAGAIACVTWVVLVPPKPRYDVFVCYRRAGGSEFAALVRDKLAVREGIRAFVDRQGLGAGPFGPALLSQIAAAPNFILIVSPGVFDRCHQESDWVREEIRQAMKRNKNIIPLVMEGCHMPERASLPADIANITGYNAVSYSNEFADAAISKLARNLKK